MPSPNAKVDRDHLRQSPELPFQTRFAEKPLDRLSLTMGEEVRSGMLADIRKFLACSNKTFL